MPVHQPSLSSSSSSSTVSSAKSRKRKWTREQLLKSLEVLGPLKDPLPAELPPSPPASRSNSPAAPSKRKLQATAERDSNKRPRTSSAVLENTSRTQQGRNLHLPPPPQRRSPNPPPSFNIRSEPSEDGELREDSTPVGTRRSPCKILSNPVPVRRPRRGWPSSVTFEEMHERYLRFGRMFKYSGDTRFWSTFSPTHKEYRPLVNPPLPSSTYHKHGGLIARLELLDALICFTYALWIRDISKRSCLRDSWTTIEAFLRWCKDKWRNQGAIGEKEKSLMGLIYMIEAFIHSRRLKFTFKRVEPNLDIIWDNLRNEMATLAQNAERAEIAATAPSGQFSKSRPPPMLPSPESIVPPKSANSTPATIRAGDTPSTNESTPPAVPAPEATSPPGPLALPSYIIQLLPPTVNKGFPTHSMIEAASKVTPVSFGPVDMFELKQRSAWQESAIASMAESERLLNLPILARHFPTTFARMMGTTLSFDEEHEPDIEDEEGELFWPGQCVTGQGLGWVCLMGRAMIKEFGREVGYLGLEGTIPKPKSGDPGYGQWPPGSEASSQVSIKR